MAPPSDKKFTSHRIEDIEAYSSSRHSVLMNVSLEIEDIKQALGIGPTKRRRQDGNQWVQPRSAIKTRSHTLLLQKQNSRRGKDGKSNDGNGSISESDDGNNSQEGDEGKEGDGSLISSRLRSVKRSSAPFSPASIGQVEGGRSRSRSRNRNRKK